MLKQIREYLFLSKQAKRPTILDRMSEYIKCLSFTINVIPNIFNHLDATDGDRIVANNMIQDLLKEIETQFKIDYQNYINEQIEYLDNETIK